MANTTAQNRLSTDLGISLGVVSVVLCVVVCAVFIAFVKKRCNCRRKLLASVTTDTKATAGGSGVGGGGGGAGGVDGSSVVLQGENEVLSLHDYNFTKSSSDDVASDEETHCRYVTASAATDSQLLQQHQKQGGAAVTLPHPPVEDSAAGQAT